MLIHAPSFAKPFADYGIAIPALPSRAANIFEALTGHPELGRRLGDWLAGDPLPQVGRDDLLLAHDAAYVDELLSDRPEEAVIRAYELRDEHGNHHRYDPAKAVRPLSEIVGSTLRSAAGTLACCRTALEHGFCYFLGGGMHHAMRRGGRGFCLVNDIAVAARRVLADGAARRVLVIDVDAHKGDGTAEICLGDDAIATLSIHMARGWPLDGPPLDSAGGLRRERWPSTVDIPMESGREEFYVPALRHGLHLLADICGDPGGGPGGAPDMAIVVNGSDPSELDQLPSSSGLRLSLPQLLARDQLVYEWLHDRGIPQAWLMSGGYGPEVWRVHAQFLAWVLPRRLGGGE